MIDPPFLPTTKSPIRYRPVTFVASLIKYRTLIIKVDSQCPQKICRRSASQCIYHSIKCANRKFRKHSVVDRVTGRNPNIFGFKGCAAGKSSGFHIPSHALQFATRPVQAFLDTNWPHENGVNPSVETVFNWHTCG